jgi:hypothetical protein
VAFSIIYWRPFTRADATRWIRDHIPDGSTVANEEWDEHLPALIDGRRIVTLPTVTLEVFEQDSPDKLRRLVEDLDASDFLFINSQRGYGAIGLHPDRYPATIRYYELLFTGQLGFEFRKGFAKYPRFLGFEINTDLADESLSVYDHPKILIFEKGTDFDAAKMLVELDAALDGREPVTRDRLIELTRQLVSSTR